MSWEWTRKQSPPSDDGGGRELAADTANMRTAHPRLSNLEEGTYTFVLKVNVRLSLRYYWLHLMIFNYFYFLAKKTFFSIVNLPLLFSEIGRWMISNKNFVGTRSFLRARDAFSNLVLSLAQVTDAKGQSAEDEVSVYVKAAVNMPPVADAGKDIVSWFWFCYRPM